MNRSILWNGFEIKKGKISTSAGSIPYLFYSPTISRESVNVAIHGEGHEKEDWLCFNSVLKLGNLLKESIRHNSPFIAFDLYGHGEWTIENKSFNTSDLTLEDRDILINKTITGIEEALPQILKDEGLTENPITVTSFSLGCSIAMGLNIDSSNYKSILISPFKADITSNCQEFYVIRGENDPEISSDEFYHLYNKLPGRTTLETHKSKHDIPSSWINGVKEYIYSTVQ